ncbi:MAG: hypothetical protein ABIL09_07770 [Gemmatimonadota bacterium]
MKRAAILVMVLGLAGAAAAAPPAFGRTDGPEGSEIGQGGYAWYRTPGQVYVEGFFGAAILDIEPENELYPKTNNTELLTGFNVGYLTEDWLGIQAGFGRILADDPVDLYTLGVRNSLNMEPFNYFLSLDAELYAPDHGGNKFGLVPGVGAEVVLSDHLQLGLRFQRDFIFANDSIAISRFTARAQYKF